MPHRTRTIRGSWDLDICSRETFETKHGRGEYRKLPKHSFVRMGGKRKAVSGIVYLQWKAGVGFGAYDTVCVCPWEYGKYAT